MTRVWLSKANFVSFWNLPITQFSKFNNFLWVCWFLGKNFSNFVPPVWKLHDPYCHSAGIIRNAGTFQGNKVIHIWKKNFLQPWALEICPKIEIYVGNWTEAPSIKLLCGFTWIVVDKTIFIFKKFWKKIVVCHVDYGILFQ